MSAPLPLITLAVSAWLLAPTVDRSRSAGRAAAAATQRHGAADTLKRADSAIVADSEESAASANLRAFHARQRAGGMGYFLDEARFNAMRPSLASEALRSVPGVVLRPTRRLVNEVRMRGCTPLIWVDGQRAAGAELDDLVRGSDVAAMEVYATMVGVPPEFTDRSATCGTVLVWTRPA